MTAEEYIARERSAGRLTDAHVAQLVRYFQNGEGLSPIDGKPGPATLARLVKDRRPATDWSGFTFGALPSEWPQGIDVSRYQNSETSLLVDWKRVCADRRVMFVFVKATEGTAYVDPEFVYNWDQLAKCGMVRGAYHFMHPDNSPEEEARHACKTIGPVRAVGTLPIMGDLESKTVLDGELLASWVVAWALEVERLCGRPPILYTYTSYWQEQLKRTGSLNRYILAQAQYTNSLSARPTKLGQWDWSFWQWKVEEKSTIPGITGGLDRDVFRGSVLDLMRLAGSAA